LGAIHQEELEALIPMIIKVLRIERASAKTCGQIVGKAKSMSLANFPSTAAELSPKINSIDDGGLSARIIASGTGRGRRFRLASTEPDTSSSVEDDDSEDEDHSCCSQGNEAGHQSDVRESSDDGHNKEDEGGQQNSGGIASASTDYKTRAQRRAEKEAIPLVKTKEQLDEFFASVVNVPAQFRVQVKKNYDWVLELLVPPSQLLHSHDCTSIYFLPGKEIGITTKFCEMSGALTKALAPMDLIPIPCCKRKDDIVIETGIESFQVTLLENTANPHHFTLKPSIMNLNGFTCNKNRQLSKFEICKWVWSYDDGVPFVLFPVKLQIRRKYGLIAVSPNCAHDLALYAWLADGNKYCSSEVWALGNKRLHAMVAGKKGAEWLVCDHMRTNVCDCTTETVMYLTQKQNTDAAVTDAVLVGDKSDIWDLVCWQSIFEWVNDVEALANIAARFILHRRTFTREGLVA
jgi:hypothetical protein